jgi:hypothetical protein
MNAKYHTAVTCTPHKQTHCYLLSANTLCIVSGTCYARLSYFLEKTNAFQKRRAACQFMNPKLDLNAENNEESLGFLNAVTNCAQTENARIGRRTTNNSNPGHGLRNAGKYVV